MDLELSPGIPRAQCPHSDELINPLDGASDGRDNFVTVYVGAMSPIVSQKRIGTREKISHLIKARAEVIDSPGDVIFAFSVPNSSSSSIWTTPSSSLAPVPRR